MIKGVPTSVWGHDGESTITFGIDSRADRRAVPKDVWLLVLWALWLTEN